MSLPARKTINKKAAPPAGRSLPLYGKQQVGLLFIFIHSYLQDGSVENPLLVYEGLRVPVARGDCDHGGPASGCPSGSSGRPRRVNGVGNDTVAREEEGAGREEQALVAALLEGGVRADLENKSEKQYCKISCLQIPQK